MVSEAELRETFEYDLIGHSMGGMLACAVAARSQHSEWSIRKVARTGLIVKCSSTNAQAVPSIYARFAALAGHLPGFNRRCIGDTENSFTVATSVSRYCGAVLRVLGPPDEKRHEDVSNPASAFWNNSVSATTCYPGATSAKFCESCSSMDSITSL